MGFKKMQRLCFGHLDWKPFFRSGALVVAQSILLVSAVSVAFAQDVPHSAPSILNPAKASANFTYRFPYTGVDPTAATNSGAVGIPGLRGENQLMIYTPAFGSSTQTNQAGWEAIVQGDRIVRVQAGNSNIPTDGFVLSGHGAAAQWLEKFAKVGSVASWDEMSRKLTVNWTPATYLAEVDAALALSENRTSQASPAFENHLQAARQCRAELEAQQAAPVSPALANLAEHCVQQAHLAYYNTFESDPAEFRGAWIRPDSVKPERVRAQVAALKQAHIDQIFLETYFQGKTAYPSEVMTAYGLSSQHPRYQGGDPVALWIQEAHAQGLKVHLWFQTFFAGNQRENLETFGPILQKYPQWRNIERSHLDDPNPVISDVEPGHYFVDPANPEVRAFLQKLIQEMVSRYDADGLNLDYIRYPASAAVGKSNHFSTTWGYTPVARAQFKAMIDKERAQAAQESAKSLSNQKMAEKVLPSADPKDLTLNNPLWPRWVAWRKEQVSSFVREVSTQVHNQKPNWLISAVVFPSHDPTYALKLQDYPRWAREGTIQALTPIGLSTNLDRMAEQCRHLKIQVENKIPVYVGIFSLYNRTGPLSLVQEIETVHQNQMGGVVLFDGARLTPPYEEALRAGPFRLPPGNPNASNTGQ